MTVDTVEKILRNTFRSALPESDVFRFPGLREDQMTGGILRFMAWTLIPAMFAGCAEGVQTSATVPLELDSEIIISNGTLDVAITDVEAIDTAEFTTSEVTVSEEYADVVSLYRVRVTFTNAGEQPVYPRHTTLDVNVPERMDDRVMYVTGFCEPLGTDPTGPADMCFKLSPPGGFGVVSVFQETQVRLDPGQSSELEYVLIVDNAYTDLVVEFPPEDLEDDGDQGGS